MDEFSNKVVLITGANGGIGRVLCEQFCAEGAAVIALDINEQVRSMASEKLFPVVADISEYESLVRAIHGAESRVGPVDVLVNNAGVALTASLQTTEVSEWSREIDVNLNGVYFCTRTILKTMKERGQGVIVTIGSVNGTTALGNPAYSAAKAAIINFMESVAVEYGHFGIRANVVAPGTVRTPAWQARVNQCPEIFSTLKKWYPLGRIAEPIDIAKAVIFLSSDRARYVTGSVLTVDGGLMAGNPIMAGELTLEQF